MVVLLVMVINVVFSLFILTLLLLILSGLLVLLYHCTHYASRGSISNDSTACGAFSVSTLLVFSNAGWYFGAALSLIHIIVFVVVILSMVTIVESFLFIMLLKIHLTSGALVLLYLLNY